ncbi:MAG: group II intron reverse transcriptase/maturase [Gemmatimonadota bacterium]
MSEAKPYDIPKQLVWKAYQRVKANRGAAGVDRVSLGTFEKDLKGNLYKIWNRMSSGAYVPPPVRLVEIPKDNGGTRPLGIPTVADRVAQTVVKMVFEPRVEPVFHDDSYGYRPGKSAIDAVGVARKRCWTTDWVIDLDIKGFFDSIPHDLVERAVARHTDSPWIRLYVARWLRAPVQRADGSLVERRKGTPQGGVISPLLANLFLHYAFDVWMQRNHPSVRFERYADDAVVHCGSEEQAKAVLDAIRGRFEQCGMELHPTKTRIVYCKDDDRPGRHEHITFDFLGYTFQPRRAKNRWGKFFVSFLPAISSKAAKKIRATIRDWRMAATRNNQRLEDLARVTNPVVQGWMNYYGRFYRSKCVQVLRVFNEALAAWVRRKYTRFRRRERASMHWLGRVARRGPHLVCVVAARGETGGWRVGAG